MSRSLTIECERVDEPTAIDPLERQTWASLRITAAGRSVTRVLDRRTQRERSTIYVPAFPIARWVVTHWWALLEEPAIREKVPAPNRLPTPAEGAWVERHCLRAAESGLLLPRAYLYSDGLALCVSWEADDVEAYPRMPGAFVDGGFARIDAVDAQLSLREFVDTVLSWIEDDGDARVVAVRKNWRAITAADVEEQAFCRAAGRMGLDPYWTSTWQDPLVDLLERRIGNDMSDPFVGDFLDAVSPLDGPAVWSWVENARDYFVLRGRPRPSDVPVPKTAAAHDSGYELARWVRERGAVEDSAPIEAFKSVADVLGVGPVSWRDHNHLPHSSVMAAVGWGRGSKPTIAGPHPKSETTARFLEARALYHAAFACERGPRLVTRAYTWDQQASRAFAAELLAPQRALVSSWESNADTEEPEDQVNRLAAQYRVSPRLIRYQLQNAGVEPEVD